MFRLLLLLLAAAGPCRALAQQQQQQQQRLRAPTFEATAAPSSPEEAARAAAPPPTAGVQVGAAPVAPVLPIPKAETPAFTPPSALYYQQRVEYTFPEPVTLAPAKLDGDEWTKAYAAFPCLDCFVTDAGCYYEYKQDRKTQIAFLTGDQYKALLAACPKPQEATKACWEAAGLKDVKVEDYAYRTYAYHDFAKGGPPTPEGAYLVLNNDANGAAEIEYGMAYFGLDPAAPSFPGGLVVGDNKADPRAPTRLKEVVQGLLKPVTLAKQQAGIKAGKARPPADPAQEGGGVPATLPPHLPAAPNKEDAGNGWTRRALAMGNMYANNGYNWWANAGAEYQGGALQGVFLSGDLYRKLTDACPETENGGILVLTKACWADAGLDSNPATQLQPLANGGRLERKYDGGADPNQGGTCVDGWWVFVNTSDQDVIISKADANFGLRTLGNSPRDNGPPRKDHQE